MRCLKSFVVISILVSGCRVESGNSPSPDIVANSETIELIATSQILPPEKIVRASIAPKPGFMASLGHILLLSGTGTVYSSNTGFGTITKVAKGEFTDILGLNFGDGPSIFLTLDKSGLIKAFAENNEEGFDPINISAEDLNADAFCQSETTPENQLQLLSSGTLRKLNIDLKSKLLEFTTISETKVDEVIRCFENDKGHVFGSNNNGHFQPLGNEDQTFPGNITQISTIGEALNILQDVDGNLYAQTADRNAPIHIKAGFSIPGVDRADWTLSTNSPMGNTFMGGLTLIANSKDNRIAMISNDYIRKTIAGKDDVTRNDSPSD